jgi:predicted nuclease with TOPRIM domain
LRWVLRIEALRGRIKDLTRERERLAEAERTKPKDWGVNPRFEQINQEIENLNREIDGQPPLVFHGSER